jgi:Fe2+ transport system protein FeoA
MTLFQCLFFKPAMAKATSHTLADVQPGQAARLKEFSSAISPQRWAHLQAYGLTPGRCVQVVQHRPVTVVRVEHTELAMEDDLARQIEVTAL